MSDFIDEIIEREGGSKETNDPSDSGGKTKYGVSKRSHPEAWADGDVSYEEAKSIYQREYINIDGISLIPDVTLMHQVADFGVTSGPDTSVRVLQQLLGVPIDGKIGPTTISAINSYPNGDLFGVSVTGMVLLNLAFRDARVIHYTIAAKRAPGNLKFILGWINRAFEFK